MNASPPPRVRTLGLFERRIAGDDALLELARAQFAEARMGAEVHAATPAQLNDLMRFTPWPEAPVVVHVPRDFDLLQEQTHADIAELAAAAPEQVLGLILHDQAELVERPEDNMAAARKLDARLRKNQRHSRLHIEYAIGLEPEEFVAFFDRIGDLENIAPCIDIGHVGIRAARAAFSKKHAGLEVCSLKNQGPELPGLMADVEEAVAAGRQVAFETTASLCAQSKPVHFHLHDGHPLSTFSAFGVADHLSFLTEIPLSFEFRGRRVVSPMFTPLGLEQVVRQALTRASAPVSFTLEIHNVGKRLPLGPWAPLFQHWADKHNAELMNHWISTLVENHALLVGAIQSVTNVSGRGGGVSPRHCGCA